MWDLELIDLRTDVLEIIQRLGNIAVGERGSDIADHAGSFPDRGLIAILETIRDVVHGISGLLEGIREEWAKLKRESGTGGRAGAILGGPQRGDALLAVELGKRPVLSTLLPSDGAAGTPPTPDILPGQPK